jgi:hypothetical protein
LVALGDWTEVRDLHLLVRLVLFDHHLPCTRKLFFLITHVNKKNMHFLLTFGQFPDTIRLADGAFESIQWDQNGNDPVDHQPQFLFWCESQLFNWRQSGLVKSGWGWETSRRRTSTAAWSSGGQVRFQRLSLFETAHAHDTKTDEMTSRVHALHHGVVFGFPHVTGSARKPHFKIIGFRVEPDFYFVGHKSSPAFGLSVRYAVTTNASFSAYLTTTHSHFHVLQNVSQPLIREPHRMAKAICEGFHVCALCSTSGAENSAPLNSNPHRCQAGELVKATGKCRMQP